MNNTSEPKNEIILTVRVIPNASHESITTTEDGTIKIKVTTIPAEGKANKAVVALLAKTYKVSKSSVQIIRGETSNKKVIKISSK